ncbi:MAG: MFS transporter [Candidatus Sungbacteria bacterium]|nr:MFS transporter [Candidatus Sungbacteria bacterium]
MSDNDAKKPTKFFGLSRNVISMGAVSFLNDLSSDMIFPFIPIFLTSVLGATATFVGLVEGIADATASVLKIVSGRLSDRWKVRKPFAVFGYSLSAIAKPVLALATLPWHVLAVRFIDRVGKGTRDAPRDALISFSTEKKNVGRAFGFHRGADTLGAALGPLVAFAILPFLGGATASGLRSLFLLSFVASLFAVLILQFSVREIKNHDVAEARPKFEFRYLGLPFIIFLIAATIFALGRASEAFLLLRARDLGVALALLPIIYFVYNITLAVFATPAGILSDKIGHRNTYMIGMLIFSGTYFLFAQATSLWVIWALFAMYGFYSAFTEGVGRAIVADLIEERWRATAYGMYNAFTGFALLPASLVFGFLWDRWGPAFSFRYGAILGLAAFAIFLFLRVGNHTRSRLSS